MGLWCIAESLNAVKSPLDDKAMPEILDIVSEQLRLLAHVVEPVRDDQLQTPSLESTTQDEFFTALVSKMEAFNVTLSLQSPSSMSMASAHATQGVILMARLLQFDLGFKSVWTPKVRSLSSKMCASVFRLVLVSERQLW